MPNKNCSEHKTSNYGETISLNISYSPDAKEQLQNNKHDSRRFRASGRDVAC